MCDIAFVSQWIEYTKEGHQIVPGHDYWTSMMVDAVRCWFTATIECPLAGGGFVELAVRGSCCCHWWCRWSLVWSGVGVISWCPFAVRMVLLIDTVGSCYYVNRPTNSPASSHWFAVRSLHDHWVCNVHSVSFPIPFLVHGHPITYYFLIIAISSFWDYKWLADNIVVMQRGEIVEQGKHQELIAKNGTYKKLVEMQTFD